MGGFGNIARTIGTAGNEVSTARTANTDLAQKQLNDRLQNLMLNLQMQELQQKLSIGARPQTQRMLGQFTNPEGKLVGIFQKPDGTIGTQELYNNSPDTQSATMALTQTISGMPDEIRPNLRSLAQSYLAYGDVKGAQKAVAEAFGKYQSDVLSSARESDKDQSRQRWEKQVKDEEQQAALGRLGVEQKNALQRLQVEHGYRLDEKTETANKSAKPDSAMIRKLATDAYAAQKAFDSVKDIDASDRSESNSLALARAADAVFGGSTYTTDLKSRIGSYFKRSSFDENEMADIKKRVADAKEQRRAAAVQAYKDAGLSIPTSLQDAAEPPMPPPPIPGAVVRKVP